MNGSEHIGGLDLVKTVNMKIPGRAIASVVFAFISVCTFRICDHLILLPGRAYQSYETIQITQEQLSPFIDGLEFAYGASAIASVVWCLLAWRSEWRIAAIVATLFSAIATYFFVWRAIEDSFSGL